MIAKTNEHKELRDQDAGWKGQRVLVLFLGVALVGATAFCASEEKPRSGAPAKEEPKSSLTRISILPFTTEDKEDKDLGERIAEELEVLLGESGRFRVLMRSEMTLEERSRLLKIQVEQGRSEERAPFQRLACEDAFLSGSIRREESGSLVIYLYVIALETGEKVIGLRSRIWHENALDRIARGFAREIVRRVDIRGKVVHIEGDSVYVSMEKGPEGVKEGDLLEVRHPPRIIKGAEGPIESGDEDPYTTLVVETITGTGHLRCALKDESSEKPNVGDEVRLVPVLPVEKRELTCAVLPFSLSSQKNSDFVELLQQEILVSGSALRGMTISNPPGIDKFTGKEVDGRIVCDALGVDAVLTGKLLVLEKEIRAYLELVLHPQAEEYQEEELSAAESVVRKRVSVPIAGKDKLTPEIAAALARKTIEAFKPEDH